ncbi:TolC family protein, partial [Francisella tularensis subsp. holarctica]|nr:TolC family protein [Francisella tularensis subsp. holarctica]
MFKDAQTQHNLGATSPMLEEVIRQQLEVKKGKIAMIKNDIVHFKNTLKILMGRNPGKIVTSRTLNEINANIKVPIN